MNAELHANLSRMCAQLSPRLVQIGLTRACNLRCRFCYPNLKRPGESKNSPMSMTREALDSALHSLGHVQEISFGLKGEDTLSPDLLHAIELARPKAERVSILTNALALDKKRIRALSDAGLDFILVSCIATDAQTYAWVTGADKFADFVQTLREIRASKISFALACTLFEENYRSLERIPEFAQDLSVKWFSMNQLKDPELFGDHGIHAPPYERVISFYQHTIERCKQLNVDCAGLDAALKTYLDNPTAAGKGIIIQPAGSVGCHFPFTTLHLYHDLSMRCCCGAMPNLPDLTYPPNLTREFNSTAMTGLRRSLIFGAPPVECTDKLCYLRKDVDFKTRLETYRRIVPEAFDEHLVYQPLRSWIGGARVLFWCGMPETYRLINLLSLPREQIIGIMDRRANEQPGDAAGIPLLTSSNVRKLPEHDICIVVNRMSIDAVMTQARSLSANRLFDYLSFYEQFFKDWQYTFPIK